MSTRSRSSGPFDLTQLLDALEGVDYIVVGGVAGTLHGTPRVTFDLDIVPETSAENLEHFAAALARLDATIREPGNRNLPVSERLLADSARAALGGQVRLRTRFGPLDILWRLHDGRGYRELKEHSVTLSDEERQVHVLNIDSLIEIKEAAGRPRDLEDVRYLKLILERTR
jgi:hypothetical protein